MGPRRTALPAAVTAGLTAVLSVLVLATPAQAQEEAGSGPLFGMVGTIVVLIVLGTVFALVWRAVSRKRSASRR